MEDRVKETKMRKQSVFAHLPIDDFDEEYEVLLLDEFFFQPGKLPNVQSLHKDIAKKKSVEEVRMVRNAVSATVLAAIEEIEKTETKIGKKLSYLN
jgi:hypothetical protein